MGCSFRKAIITRTNKVALTTCNSAAILDAKTGKEEWLWFAKGEVAEDVALSPNLKNLAKAVRDRISLWNVPIL